MNTLSGLARWRSVLQKVALFAFGVVLAVAVGELSLRARFEHLAPRLRSYLTNCYDPTDAVNGIYYTDPRLNLTVPRPNFSTKCAWNDLEWHHRGDQDGFRNTESRESVDVALLGDSIVYGHGVEEPDTIAGCLRSRHGLRTTNFGLTGASPVHYLAFSRNYVFRHHPRATVVIVFANDLDDISAQRTPDAIRAFLETRAAVEMLVLPANELATFAPRPGLVTRILRQSFFLRGVGYGFRGLAEIRAAHAEPFASASSEHEGRSGQAIGYLRTALQVIAENARDAHSTLLVLYVPAVQSSFSLENFRIPSVLADASASLGFEFIDATESLMADPAHEMPGTRLALDGHLSGKGACLVADLIAESLRAPTGGAPLGAVLSITSPRVRLDGFWHIESDEVSSFAWTKDESTMEVSGLPPGVALTATLYVRGTGGTTRIGVSSVEGDRQEAAVSSDAISTLRHAVRADSGGRLRMRIDAHTFRPSDRGPSNDHRDLGVAISGVRFARSTD